jgi:hypothetical protein
MVCALTLLMLLHRKKNAKLRKKYNPALRIPIGVEIDCKRIIGFG